MNQLDERNADPIQEEDSEMIRQIRELLRKASSREVEIALEFIRSLIRE